MTCSLTLYIQPLLFSPVSEIVCVKKQSSGKANGGSLVPVEEFVDTSSMETSNAREQATKGQQLSELATFLLRSEVSSRHKHVTTSLDFCMVAPDVLIALFQSHSDIFIIYC